MKRILSIILLTVFISVLLSGNVFANGDRKTVGVLTFREFDTYCWLIKCDESASGEIIIPESVEFNGSKLPVTAIDIFAMEGGTGIKKGPFTDCVNITSIKIPDSVTKIGIAAFSGCTGLKKMEIPGSVVYIGASAFYNCTGLEEVKISDGVTEIEGSAFNNCVGLSEITIPSSVTSISANPFPGCVKLENIYVDENNGNYSSYDGVLFSKDKKTLIAFPCAKSDSYEIPDGVEIIGTHAFSGCSGLKTISIPESVSEIDASAFGGCTSVKQITIPDSVTKIGMNAFYFCTGITSIRIPSGITYISEFVFERCENLISVIIPISVTSIGMGAFSGCSNLKTVYYEGDKEQWKDVIIEDDMFDENYYVRNAETVFNYKEPEPGDTNGDGEFNNKDVVTLFRFVSGNAGYDAVYDFNGDNEVNNKDVVALFRYVSTAK